VHVVKLTFHRSSAQWYTRSIWK